MGFPIKPGMRAKAKAAGIRAVDYAAQNQGPGMANGGMVGKGKTLTASAVSKFRQNSRGRGSRPGD